MKQHLKQILALLLALCLTLALTACGQEKSDDPEGEELVSTAGKDLVKTMAGDYIFSLNSNSRYSFRPTVATNHSNQLICDLVYENMIELGNDFEVIEGAGLIIAEESTVSEDGKVWTFKMRTDHVFHDGSEVTSNDLRLSLENAIIGDRFSGRFRNVAGVSYWADELVVTLYRGDKQFIKLLNIPVCKAKTFGDDHPIGSGPYTWNEDGTKLLAFTGHNGYDSLPVEEIYVKEYTAAAEILSAFEDSLIDAVVNDPSSVTNLGYASTNETRTFATTNYHFVAFNQQSALGRMTSLRNALNYGFDRNYFAQELMKNRAVGSTVPMFPSCKDYPSALAADSGFNLERLLLILENYGITDYDDDGRLELSQGGDEINLVFIVPADSSAKAGVANKFAQDMASIGITVDVRELSWSEYTEALDNGYLTDRNDHKEDFDMFYGEVKLRNNFDLNELLAERIQTTYTKEGTVIKQGNEATNCNYTGSFDNSFLNLNDRYLAASPSERADRFEELARTLIDNGAYISIGFELQEMITHRGVIKGVNPNAGNPMFDFQHWEIDLS